MRPFVRGEPLWHVSDRPYAVGQTIGPHGGPSPHWLNTRTHARWAAHEDVFERLRPRHVVSRMTCLFATDSAPLVRLLVAARPKALVYRVSVPAEAAANGRFDMQLVNTRLEAAPAARDYWAGKACEAASVRAEVLATELLVEAALGVGFSDDVRHAKAELTLAELERALVVP